VPGKWLVPVVAVAVLAASCSGNKSMLNEKDPFNDPFFSDGLGSGTRSLDELMREPAPSVGWLAHDGAVQSRPQSHDRGGSDGLDAAPDGDSVLLQAENEGHEVAHRAQSGDTGETGEDGELVESGQKSTYEQASEATMATMSVLFGLGMAALPFLIGT
jgi:hypothetical protein